MLPQSWIQRENWEFETHRAGHTGGPDRWPDSGELGVRTSPVEDLWTSQRSNNGARGGRSSLLRRYSAVMLFGRYVASYAGRAVMTV